MNRLNPNIFREYDIRGIVDEDLTPDTVRVIGRAFGTWLASHGNQRACVGRDCRESSPVFAGAIADGLLETGIDVVDLGVVPTPLLYFSLHHLDVPAGVMVTGSHNPVNFNGFKLCADKNALFGQQIAEVRDIAGSGSFARGEGAGTEQDVVPAYLDRVASDARLGPRKLKVVVDAGNGTGGVVALPLLERLGVDVVPLYCDMDGTFPNHHPDPTVIENLADLRRTVVESGADLGIAFDGDADRLGVVTEDGEVLYGDMVLLVLARALLAEEPGAVVVSEVKCSQVLFDEIEKAGGRAIMWKVGHSLIKAKMAREGALLGGEMSGHIFFRHRWYGFDDAVYSGTRFLEVLSGYDGPASSLLDGVPRPASTPEIRLECPDDLKFEVVKRMRDLFVSRSMEVVDVDGVRVKFAKGWGLVRPSNTQPVLVFRFEAEDEEALDAISTAVLSKAEEIKNGLSAGKS